MDSAMQKMIDNLEENTGKSLGYWTELVQESGIEKHGAIVKMLKEDHGLGHGYANMLVLHFQNI